MVDAKLELPSPMPFNTRIPFLKPYWDHKEFLQILKTFAGCFVAPHVIEDMVRRKFDLRYAIAVNKGRTAAYLGMKALGLKDGKEIICPSFFCRTLTQAILQLGCVPVYADVDEDLNISPDSIRRCISKNTKAVIMTHMFGKLARIDDILKIAKEYNLFVIDNAAVAVGALHHGRYAGTFGDVGIISFNMSKQMNATGGGILLTDLEDVYEKVLRENLPSQSIKKQLLQIFYNTFYYYLKKYATPLIIFKRTLKMKSIPEFYRQQDRIPESLRGKTDIPEEFKGLEKSILFEELIPKKMNQFESSLAFIQLNKLDEIIQKNVKNARSLTKRIKEIKEIDAPQGDYPEHVFSYYTIIVKKGSRYDLASYLAKNGVETQWTFYPIHLQERFNGYRKDNLQVTEDLWQKVLSLPMGPYLSDHDIDYIADLLMEYFSR